MSRKVVWEAIIESEWQCKNDLIREIAKGGLFREGKEVNTEEVGTGQRGIAEYK